MIASCSLYSDTSCPSDNQTSYKRSAAKSKSTCSLSLESKYTTGRKMSKSVDFVCKNQKALTRSNRIVTSSKYNLYILLLCFVLSFATTTFGMPTALPSSIAYSDAITPPSKTTSASSSSTAIAGIDTDGGYTSMPTPRAFDTSIASDNFTSPGCLPFFSEFLANETFIACQPFSFFIKTSKSWFDITKAGLISTTKALDATCNVNLQVCSPLMNDLALRLLSPDTCGAEFKSRNPVVTQAYASFVSYDVLYKAGCQKSSEGYCYADAITNSTNQSDYVLYYLPIGISLPGGSRLTCSKCLQETMAIYAEYASNTSQPLYDTYPASSQLINIGCGPNFVSTALAASSASSRIRQTFSTTSIVLLLAAIYALT